MKKRSQSGVARVSAVWMIVVVVLFLVSLAYGFISNDDAARAEQDATDARAAEVRATTRAQDELTKAQDVSNLLGYYDRNVIGALSESQTAQDGLQQLKDSLPGLGADVTDFENAVPLVIAAYAAKLREIQTLATRITDLEGQVTAAQQAQASIASLKDDELRTARQQLSDANNTLDDTKTQLEQRIAQLTADLNQKDRDLKTAEGAIDDQRAQADTDAQAARTQIANMTKKLAFLGEPEAADGEITTVSEELRLGWIDIGAQQRVTRGIRFDVRSGNPAERLHKGVAEVISVQPTRSEVRFVSVRDRYLPIVPGDVIYNPLFDPKSVLNAVLAGRFSGSYNERELRVLLADVGINVQDELDLTTTHLIVGNEVYVDADGEPVEDPIQPSELPVYKDAQANGVNIVSINDVRRFFRQ